MVICECTLSVPPSLHPSFLSPVKYQQPGKIIVCVFYNDCDCITICTQICYIWCQGKQGHREVSMFFSVCGQDKSHVWFFLGSSWPPHPQACSLSLLVPTASVLPAVSRVTFYYCFSPRPLGLVGRKTLIKAKSFLSGLRPALSFSWQPSI